METDSTNLVGGDDTASATVADDTGVAADDQQIADDQQFDADGNPIAPDEDEEVELDADLKLKVPKAAAAKLKELQEGNLRQADYTRKTQELADARKAFEAERQTVQQASQAEIAALAQVTVIDQQLAYYERIDWDAYEQQDPFTATSEFRKYQQLQKTRAQAAGQFSQLQQQRQLQQQQEIARRMDEGRAVLAREIKGWGPELAEKLLGTAEKEYGFKRGEAEESITDPRMMKVLHDAYQYRLDKAKQTKAQGHVAAQQAEPAARPASARSGPPAGLDDRLSVDEWARRRNEQVRKRPK